jgi:hypothetical protein
MNTRSDREKPLSGLAGRALRRLSGLAGSGVDLGLLGRSQRDGCKPDLDRPKKAGESCRMRRFAVAPVAALAAVVASLVGASAAHAVTGGCSVQSAPLIKSGQTQTSDPYHCPDNKDYWAIDLKIGDTLNVDINPAPPSVFEEPYLFDIYGPNVGTIGNFLCQSEGAGASRVSCVIPATGRYVLVSYGAGTFTPAVKSVPAQTGRVPGPCDPVNAPAAASQVTQYANGMLCQPSGSTQYWSMALHRGDILSVSSLAMPSSGNSEPFDLQVYGPSATALGAHVCGNSGFGPAYSFSCPIQAAGRYVLAASNSGSFTPLVTRPTKTGVHVPRVVKGGGAIVMRATVRSDAPNPTGTCLFQKQSGKQWKTFARVHTATGSCKSRLRAPLTGKLHLRVHFKGAKGWGSSTSKPVTVVVR